MTYGEKVWLAFLAEPKIAEKPPFPPGGMEILSRHVKDIATGLAHCLPEVVSITSLRQSYMYFVGELYLNGFAEQAMEVLPLEAFNIFPKEVMIKKHNLFLVNEICRIKDELRLGLQLLNEKGLTEDDIILGDEFGLEPDLREQYLAGTLTIEQLLLVRPSVILMGFFPKLVP